MGCFITHDHWISVAHRLVGHKGGCGRIHGHNYLIEMKIRAHSLNQMGMILDFSDVKRLLDKWVDDNWDHRLMLASYDPILQDAHVAKALTENGLVVVDFNPTAEHMSMELFKVFNDILSKEVPQVWVQSITIHETATGRATHHDWRPTHAEG